MGKSVLILALEENPACDYILLVLPDWLCGKRFLPLPESKGH
jgi:hypothetical protein